MADPFLGEVRIFAGNFAPRDWALCNGALLPISENDALFALIGTTYGGDGQSTFGLPDLRGRVPMHQGTGPGLSTVVIGQRLGTETVTLTLNQIPAHNHAALATSLDGSSTSPAGTVWAAGAGGARAYSTDTFSTVNMATTAVASTGGSQPHENTQPYLAINYIIALFGIFPSRS